MTSAAHGARICRRCCDWPRFGRINFMSSEVPIEIEDKPTAVTIMRELVEHLQGTIEALKREIVRNPKRDEYRKALKSTR